MSIRVLRVVANLLQDVVYRASPYQDARPDPRAIELIVVHGISLPPGRFGTGVPLALFAGELPGEIATAFPDLVGLRVSAHLFIDRQGVPVQCVPFDRRAWHAGRSQWRDRVGCNDFSIGIELEGTDHVPYAPAQYDTLATVVRALRIAYPAIGADAVVGHEHIAPGRKSDPGPAFDWRRLARLLA